MVGIPRTVAIRSLNLLSDKYRASRIGCEIVNANDINTAPAASSASGRLLLFATSFHESMLAATITAHVDEVTASQRQGNCTCFNFGRISQSGKLIIVLINSEKIANAPSLSHTDL